ncbi:sensor histidine kinase [Microbispora sp. NPDC049125]|uniref:sensor histidine kinase n=1 Tax=Microbispora sp. NPDC049125 TaxID=3154929 RepID=UPI00346686F7
MTGLRAAWRALRRPRVADSLLALLVWAFQASLAFSTGAPASPIAVLALDTAASAALLRRRDRPFLVVTITVACHLAGVVIGHGQWAAGAATCALYSAGRHGAPRRAWITAVAVDLSLAAVAQTRYFVDGVKPSPTGALGALIIVGLGQLLRLRRELADRARADLAEAAVRAERHRIARELHDVVAHHISTMNVLIGAARTTMARRPEQAEATLITAEHTGREAMAEMRHLLHVLRADDAFHNGPSGAGYGTAALPGLVARASDTGLPVTFEVTGDPVELDAMVDHTIYRVVQEALTNIRKHAGGAGASVRLGYEPGAVEVEVLDDGPGLPGSTEGPDTGAGGGVGGGGGAHDPDAEGGYGLGGMAERVAACGGRLRAGPRPGGGFEVLARLPLSVTTIVHAAYTANTAQGAGTGPAVEAAQAAATAPGPAAQEDKP